jgi:serine/threonine-protein kinase RsbW
VCLSGSRMHIGHVATFSGTRAAFGRAFDDLRRTLDRRELPQKARCACELVFEEVVTNIFRHAYRDDREHDITVSIDFPDSAIVMQFEDDGVPFDPSEHRPATQSGSILDVEIGGRGLTLLQAAASRLEYTRTADHRNRLTVTVGTGSQTG